MNEVYTLKCWKISNYPLLTWEIEYSVDPDNPRYLELFFVSLPSSSYRILLYMHFSRGNINTKIWWSLMRGSSHTDLIDKTDFGLCDRWWLIWEVVITRDSCTRRFDFNFLKKYINEYIWSTWILRKNNIEELCKGAFLCCIYGDILW